MGELVHLPEENRLHTPSPANRATERTATVRADSNEGGHTMNHYYIIRDGEIVETSTNKKSAMSTIRAIQEEETHQWIKANFELLTQDDRITPPDVSAYPICWHILDGKRIVGSVSHRVQLECLSGIPSIFGKLESVGYPRRRRATA